MVVVQAILSVIFFCFSLAQSGYAVVVDDCGLFFAIDHELKLIREKPDAVDWEKEHVNVIRAKDKAEYQRKLNGAETSFREYFNFKRARKYVSGDKPGVLNILPVRKRMASEINYVGMYLARPGENLRWDLGYLERAAKTPQAGIITNESDLEIITFSDVVPKLRAVDCKAPGECGIEINFNRHPDPLIRTLRAQQSPSAPDSKLIAIAWERGRYGRLCFENIQHLRSPEADFSNTYPAGYTDWNQSGVKVHNADSLIEYQERLTAQRMAFTRYFRDEQQKRWNSSLHNRAKLTIEYRHEMDYSPTQVLSGQRGGLDWLEETALRMPLVPVSGIIAIPNEKRFVTFRKVKPYDIQPLYQARRSPRDFYGVLWEFPSLSMKFARNASDSPQGAQLLHLAWDKEEYGNLNFFNTVPSWEDWAEYTR